MSGPILNINDLILALEELGGENLEKDSELFKECQEVFGKLKLDKRFNPNKVKDLVVVLKSLDEVVRTTKIEELDLDVEKLESRALNKQDLETLMRDYEEAKSGLEREIIGKEIYKRTGKENVQKFIEGQKIIAQRNAENLEVIGKINPKLRDEIVQELTKIEEGMKEVEAKRIEEIVLEEREYKKEELRKEVEKIVKDKNQAAEVVKKVAQERAQIKVNKDADIISKKICEELRAEQSPVTQKIQDSLRENILKSWEGNEKLVVPDGLKVSDQNRITLEKAAISAKNYRSGNWEAIIDYRNGVLEREIGNGLRNNGYRNEEKIARFIEVSQELLNNPRQVDFETDKEVLYQQIEKGPAQGARRYPSKFAVEDAEFIVKNLTTEAGKFNNLIKKYNGLVDSIGAENLPKLPQLQVLERMGEMFRKNPRMLRMLNSMQRLASWQEKLGIGAGKFVESLAIKMGMKEGVGGLVGKLAVEIVSNGSLSGGVEGMLLNFLGGSAGIQAIESSALGGTLVGKALIGANKLLTSINGGIVKFGKGIVGKLGSFGKGLLGVGSKVGSAISTMAGSASSFFAGLASGAGASMGALVAIVFVCVVLFATGCTLDNHSKVGSIVPPPAMENCVLKSGASGVINCDQNAPENTVAGVSKENFISVASRWHTGKNYASECYNDVVNRALCAGVNPTYALWAWLHESGASNYSIDEVEDFGIHGQSSVPAKNFTAQINYFLNLNPGSACSNLNYWLSFATNYLNGGCNPDEGNELTGITGRQYLTEMQNTWSMISSLPMPGNISVSKGGANCENYEEESSAASSSHSYEYTDDEGNVYVCTGGSTSGGRSEYDPNSPGLSGESIEGECSVADKTVLTKQCDPAWGSTRLNGEMCASRTFGTICNAGCGPTSVSMVLRRINGSFTPNTVIFRNGSAYSSMGCGGSSLGQAAAELTKELGASAITYDATTLSCDERAIGQWICDGKIVMVLANFYRNNSLGLGGHFVLAVAVQNGKIVTKDPYYDVATPFDGTQAYGYAHDIGGCLLIDASAVR